MITITTKLAAGLRRRAQQLRASGDEGFTTVEWIFLIVIVLGIAGVVAIAVNAFVQGQIAQLPG